jgi:hypothetical protein
MVAVLDFAHSGAFGQFWPEVFGAFGLRGLRLGALWVVGGFEAFEVAQTKRQFSG